MSTLATEETFDKLLPKKGYTVVDFFAPWCGPCKFVSPFYEKLANDNPKILFLKVNIDENPDLTEEWDVQSLPTFRFFKDGEVLPTVIKGADLKGVEAVIEKFDIKKSKSRSKK